MKQQPKVLFIARRFPPSVGGMQRFAYDLSQSLDNETGRLDVVAWGGSNKWLSILALPWLFCRAVYKLLTIHDYDILHIQDGVTSPLGWLLHILSGRPYVVVVHGLDVTYQNILYKAIPWFLRHSAAVISISAATTQEVQARGVQTKRLYTIPLGISDNTKNVEASKNDIAQLIGKQTLEECTLLLTVGRLVKRKGVAWFIREVFPGIVRSNPNVAYIVVGEGVERATIEQTIKEKKLAGKVFLLGEVPEATKYMLYKACDIFVMPNIKVPGDIEGFGIVGQEAAVAGLPVVASNLEGIADALKNGKSATLVEPDNIAAFTEAIEELVKSKTLRQKRGAAARAYTQDTFGWDEVAARYAAVYQRLLRT